MLFLQPLADAAAEVPPLVPIADETGLAFERALLALDGAARQRVLSEALAADRNAAVWALRLAETRLGRTINHVEEAAAWLSGCLVAELAAALASDGSATQADGIGWRLPLLTEKLLECERRIGEFERKLEHEKLESLKELAYGASHEINNPLANIAARAQTLLEDESDSERQRKLVAIHRQAMRAHEMISDLMLFARPPKLNLAICEFRTIVQQVVGELRERAEANGVELTCECTTESIELLADETQLGVAIGALLKNSLEAVGDGGHVQVAVRRVLLAGQHWAEMTVSDDGPGISENVRRHMFDPFFSGREAGRGLGFGASKCWRIVTDHGGQVIVQQSGRSGAEITIHMPLGTDAKKHVTRQR